MIFLRINASNQIKSHSRQNSYDSTFDRIYASRLVRLGLHNGPVSDRHVPPENTERPLISWLRTHLINAGQSNVVRAQSEARLVTPLIRAGLLPSIAREANMLTAVYPDNHANYMGVFSVGLPITSFPNLAFVALYRNYQTIEASNDQMARQRGLQTVRSQYYRIRDRVDMGEVLMVTAAYANTALESAIAEMTEELHILPFPVQPVLANDTDSYTAILDRS